MHISSTLPIQGNNILIIGNRSYKNLGDELILAGTIKLLQQQNKKIYIQAYDIHWLKRFLGQLVDISDIIFLREIPKWPRSLLRYLWKKWWEELWEYRKIDSVIVGWWEILTEENKNSYRYRLISLLPVLTKKIIVKINIYLMGWIQIPKKNLNLMLFKELLKHVKHIYARDFETIDALKTYGYDNIDFFMDTAYFAWDWKSTKKSGSQSTKKYIIVNVNKNGEQFLENIIQDIKSYIKKWYHIYYVPVSKGNSLEYDDKKYYNQLKQHISLELLDWEHDIKTFFEVLCWAEITISTRLHLFLIASFLGVETKVYPYQKKILKMQNVLEKIQV